MRYLLAAIEQIQPTWVAQAQHELQEQRQTKRILTVLLHDIAQQPDQHVRIILDDYHLIRPDNEALHEAVRFLIDHAPPQLQLVIASRNDLPWSIAKLRTQQQVSEIRFTNLRFTPDEIQQFLQAQLPSPLSQQHLQTLAQLTEGWVVGLQMAMLQLQSVENLDDFFNQFRGTDRFMTDYLLNEVFTQQPKAVQTFLLQTSILQRLQGDLCNALLQVEDSHQTLVQLEAMGLLITPLDNHQQWYRYHHLFLDFLRERLNQTHPDHILTLHQRASAWFANQSPQPSRPLKMPSTMPNTSTSSICWDC